MSQNIVRLYPLPSCERPLEGLYLGDVAGAGRKPATDGAGTFVYTNFITSLDGRISQPEPRHGRRTVPPALANPRDWRLYAELAAQADVLLTTGAHLRAVAAGRHGDLLTLDHEVHADIRHWRREQGLPAQVPCAAVSGSLDIPASDLRTHHRGPVLVITGDVAATARAQALAQAGIEIVRAGAGLRLTGRAIIDALVERGYRRIYCIGGPRLLHALLEADVIDSIYLTLAQTILAGERYDTLTQGPPLDPPRGFDLRELYFDPYAPAHAGQLFACFDRVRLRDEVA